MQPLQSPNKVGILSNSKKIKKLDHCPHLDGHPPSRIVHSTQKRYRTYSKSEKMSMVKDLRKALEPHFQGKDYSNDDLVEHIETLNKEEYNQIIENILVLHAPKALRAKKRKDRWQKDLKSWRRQLKLWAKTIEKPDKRGNARVVNPEKLKEFKERMTSVLKSLPNRSFKLLREKAVDVLEDMHKREKGILEPFKRETFSKHFWYDFKKVHPELEILYNAIPISRNKRKGKPEGKKEGIFKDLKANGLFGSLDKESHGNSESHGSDDDEMICEVIISEGEESDSQCSLPIFQDEQTSFYAKSIIPIDGLQEQSIYQESDTKEQRLDLSEKDQKLKEPNLDFCSFRRVIIEPEENEVQKIFFRHFCDNGI